MTDFVWSCPDCENLLGLLHDEEMIELMECFDNFDMDCGKLTLNFKSVPRCPVLFIRFCS